MKDKPDLSEFAIPLQGIRNRGVFEERIKIEGARSTAKEMNSEAASAKDVRAPQTSFVANGRVTAERKRELADVEDADLLRRFQDGDEASFYVLFERRHKEIWTHCF